MLALAAGLREAGHFVRFATPKVFEANVQAAGVDFYPLAGDPSRFLSGPAGAWIRDVTRRPDFFEKNKIWTFCIAPGVRSDLRNIWDACRGFDSVICSPWYHIAPSLSEKLDRPCFFSTIMPGIWIPSAELPNPVAFSNEDTPARGSACRRSWRINMRALLAHLEILNEWRTNMLGLRPVSTLELLRSYRKSQFLLSYSASVLPKPGDWPANIHVTGFWFMNSTPNWGASAELTRFLEEHPNPLLVGFSSQVARDPEAFTRSVTAAVERSGKSAILLKGWGGLRQTDLPSRILLLDWLPYEWIVPRCSAFLHHGGCGSMAMALRHGIPNMAIPFAFDQMLWARRIAQLGLGPAPMNAEAIDVDHLTESLIAMTEDPGIKQRAAVMAKRISIEDGVRSAIQVIEETLNGKCRN